MKITSELEKATNALADLAIMSAALETIDDIALEEKSIDQYQRDIRAAVRGLWNDTFDFVDFFLAMQTAIESGFTRAWSAGARACGVRLSELTSEERVRLQQEVIHERGFIAGFGDYVERNRRGDGLLRTVFRRAAFWVQGYDRVRNLAMTMACGDRKARWQLNPAEHCLSCISLSGKVKRYSYWAEQGVHPKAWDKLLCRQNCKCEFVETDEPLTPGPLPGLP
jgi:hypothetical protein